MYMTTLSFRDWFVKEMKIEHKWDITIARHAENRDASEFHSYAVARMVCYEKISVTSLVVTHIGGSGSGGNRPRNLCGRSQRAPIGCIDTKIKDVCTYTRNFNRASLIGLPGFPREIFAGAQNCRVNFKKSRR